MYDHFYHRKTARTPVLAVETGEVFETRAHAAHTLGCTEWEVITCLMHPDCTVDGLHLRYLFGFRSVPRSRKIHTLCWDCANACGRCSWSRCTPHGDISYTPVPGWLADAAPYLDGDAPHITYHVRRCPQFSPDERSMTNG